MAVGQIISRAIAQGAVTADDIGALEITHAKLHTDMDLSSKTVTMPAVIRGPATLTIDPAAVGDNTGLVVIAGDLQVDGTTTTINSTTMTVDDKNIVLASGAGNSSAADGAGITIDGASATMLYTHATTSFDFNKQVNITGDLTITKSVGDTKLIIEADSDNNNEADNAFIVFKLDGGFETSGIWTGNYGGSNDNSLNLTNAGAYSRGISFGTSATNNGWETATERMRIAKDGDITFYGANYNMVWDTSDNALEFGDNAKVTFGADSDLQIYHDASDSYIKDTGTGNLLIQYSDLYFSKDGGSTHSVVFRSTGNVGIGTTGPVSSGYDTGSTKLTVMSTTLNNATSGYLELASRANSNGYNAGAIQFNNFENAGTSGSGVQNRTVGQIRTVIETGDSNAGDDSGGNMQFWTKPEAGSLTQNMTIHHSGNIGIGVASPGAKLSVSGPAALANLGGGSTGSSALYVNSTSGHTGELIQVLKNGTTKMHMANDGKLGIGTASPDVKLHVEETTSNTGVGIKLESASWDSTLTLANGSHSWEILNDYSNSSSLAFYSSQGAAVRAIIDGSGNVGIGITPTDHLTAGYNLRLYGGTQTYLAFNNSTHTTQVLGGFVIGNDGGAARITQRENQPIVIATNDTTAMTITNTGDVGIGATNPGGSRLYLQDTHTTTVTNATTMIANTTLTINGNSSQGSDVMRMGPMGTGGKYFIDVSNSAGSAAYDLLLNPIGGGKVGIGTISPLVKLDLGVTSPNDQVIALRQNGVSRTTLGITNNYGVRVAGPSDALSTGPVFEVGQNNASDGTTYQNTRFTVLYNGKVGIGISGPGSLLHINGGGGTTAEGRLQHTDTVNTTHTGASNTAYNITNASIIGGKLRFSIQVYFANGYSNLAVRIYNQQTSLWMAGEVCIGSTYSNASATGLNRYSFSHNYNSGTNYGYTLNQTEYFGQVPNHFTFNSHGYDATEGSHYFEFRHNASSGNTMYLQFEGMGSTPAHANLTNWYYKHKTF